MSICQNVNMSKCHNAEVPKGLHVAAYEFAEKQRFILPLMILNILTY
jgi:hypothetical protein